MEGLLGEQDSKTAVDPEKSGDRLHCEETCGSEEPRSRQLSVAAFQSFTGLPSGSTSTTWSSPSYGGRSKPYFLAIAGVTNLDCQQLRHSSRSERAVVRTSHQ